MLRYIAPLFTSLVLVFGLSTLNTAKGAEDTTGSYSFSFENDTEGWKAAGVALDAPGGGGQIPWSISRSQEMAKDGATSLRLWLFNINDAGTIYIQRPFPVEANQLYEARVQYSFASRDYGKANLFTIVTGVLKSEPTAENLAPANKDETGNGSDQNVGYLWIDKEYDFTVRSETDELWVVIGVWGTYETQRTYFLDDVRVTLTKKPEGSQFYSFEDDLEGWTPNVTDLDSGSGSVERVEQYALGGEDGKYSINLDLNSVNENGKVWIEKPFTVEPGRKYNVALDYAFHSTDCTIEPRFRIISGVFRRRPESGEDLTAAVQEKTTSCTWGWLHKSYNFTIKSKKSDTLYLIIGLWGTQKGHRTYNVDSVCVTIAPK